MNGSANYQKSYSSTIFKSLMLAFFMLFSVIGVYAQQGSRIISGTVVDENGEPLPGAHVMQKNLYSFSPTSGQTTANEIYTCADGEEITCLTVFYSEGGGGFPTAGYALWIGVWNESKKEGKLLEWEIDADNGVPSVFWGPMFGADRAETPYVTTGFGKIKSIVAI